MIDIYKSVLTGEYYIVLYGAASDWYIAMHLNLSTEEYISILKSHNAYRATLGYVFKNKEDAYKIKDLFDAILLMKELEK